VTLSGTSDARWATTVLLSEMRALPIRCDILDKWLWRNAAALMGIDVGPSLGS